MKKAMTAILCVLLATGAFALGFYGGVFALLLFALFIPMVFIYLCARADNGITIACVLGFGALVYLMAGINHAGVMMCCALLPALIGGYVIRRKTTFYYSALFSGIAMLASLGVLLLCVSLLYKISFTDLVLSRLERDMTANPVAAQTLHYLLGGPQAGAEPKTSADAAAMLSAIFAVPPSVATAGVMRVFTPQMAVFLPSAAAFCVPMFGLLNYLIPRAALKKAGAETGVLPPFSLWSLPRPFGMWSVTLLVLALLGANFGWRGFDLVYAISTGLLTAVYSVQGMAFVDWLLKKKIASGAGRTALNAVLFVALGLTLNLYMWLGLFEQIVELRKRKLRENGE